MSEHKPPENEAREREGDTPDWIAELYDDADAAMPPETLDADILRTAAKKLEAPLPARGRQQIKRVSALATAAVLVLTAGVFFSGVVNEQILTPQALPEKISVSAQQMPERSSKRLIARDLEEADSFSPALLKDAEVVSGELISGKTEMYVVSALRARPANIAALSSAAECDSVVRGICISAERLFAVHPECAVGFMLPLQATDPRMDAQDVIYLLGEMRQRAQCENGEWRDSVVLSE